MARRRVLDRDSGLGLQPMGDSGDEDDRERQRLLRLDEEEEEQALAQPLLNPDQQAENNDDDEIEELPPDPNVPVIMAQGGQLAILAEYDGSGDVDIYLDMCDTARETFGCNHAITAASVKTKLTGDAARWLSSQRKLNNLYPTWNDADEPDEDCLRKGLRKRFKPHATDLEATEAVANLTQKERENVHTFFDRVVLAVDIKNFHFTEEEKQEEGYIRGRDHDIRTFFAAGLKPNIKALVLGGGNPPDTADATLTRAAQVEASLRKQAKCIAEMDLVSKQRDDDTPPGASGLLLQVDGGESPTAMSTSSDNSDIKLEKLAQELAVIQKQFTCHGCQKPGHFVRDCPERKGGRGRGRRGRGGGRGRGRRQINPGNPPQAYFGQFGYYDDPREAQIAMQIQQQQNQQQRQWAPWNRQARPVYSVENDFRMEPEGSENF